MIILPSAEHLRLLDILSILILLIHLPYIGIVLGSTSLSLFFHVKDLIEPAERTKRLGKDVLQIVPINIPIFAMLGIIPLITLMLVYSEWFYETTVQISNYFGFIIGTGIIGLVFIYLYHIGRKRDKVLSIVNLVIGLIGLGIVLNAYYVLMGTITIFLFPEYWNILDLPLPVIFSWNAVARFSIFTICSFSLTGLGILFFWYHWKPRELDETYSKFVRNVGVCLSLVCVFTLPILEIWQIGTTPQASFSCMVYCLYVLTFIFLSILGIKLIRLLLNPTLKSGGSPFVLFIFVILFLITTDEIAKENVNLAHINFISDRAELIKVALEDKRTAGMKVTIDLGLGEQVYKNKCSTCHAFDHKIVGPPHNEVVPKYINDQETMKKFIRGPWKINPAYPQMPAQALNKKELESVVAYMIKHVQDEQKAGQK